MGNLAGKDIFRKLGKRIDGMEIRAPWNDKLHAILTALYSEEEANVVIKMPYGMSNFEQPPMLDAMKEGVKKKGKEWLLEI